MNTAEIEESKLGVTRDRLKGGTFRRCPEDTVYHHRGQARIQRALDPQSNGET